jgi:hypothetical protein
MYRFTIHRNDNAKAAIIRGLKEYGCSIHEGSGKNGPDIWVGIFGRTTPLEIKSDEIYTDKRGYSSRRMGKLRTGQKMFWQTWKGGGGVVHNLKEALKMCGITMAN